MSNKKGARRHRNNAGSRGTKRGKRQNEAQQMAKRAGLEYAEPELRVDPTPFSAETKK